MIDTLSRSTSLPDLSIFRRFFDRFSQRVESTARYQHGGSPKKTGSANENRRVHKVQKRRAYWSQV